MTHNLASEQDFLIHGGDAATLINGINWSAHPLGNPNIWDQLLKQTLSLILDNPCPMLVVWGGNYFTFYNDAFIKIIGNINHTEVIGKTVSDQIFKENYSILQSHISNAYNGFSGTVKNLGIILNRKNYAEDCFFDFDISPIRKTGSEICGAFIVCKETTEKVKSIITQQDFATLSEELAEAIEEYATTNEELSAANEEMFVMQQDLQRSEKLFKSIALNIPKSLIIVIDKNHRFITIEGDLMIKLGYNDINYAGLHPTDVAPKERYEATKHYYDRLLAGETFSEEMELSVGGIYKVHFVPLRNDVDEVTSGLIIALDITDIKQAEERSLKLAAIVESSDDAIISKTLDSVITSWNDAAQRMFGYTSEEIIGEKIYKLIPIDRTNEEPEILNRLKNGEHVKHFETQRLTKAGNLIHVSLTISPLKDKEGNIIGLSKIARDITAQKLEEQRKNDFVAMVSHELKTPLTTISSYVQILLAKSKTEGDEFRMNALTRTQVQTKKMVSMIHDFLSLARLDDGKITLNKSVFELHPLIEEVVTDAKILSTKHEIEISDCEEVLLYADRDKIGQVLNNLLSNAVKYSPSGGNIVIGCTKEENHVRIFVKDNGIGITKEDQQRLFQRFFRSSNEQLKGVSGFGIGLYLVSEVLRFHGSKMELISEENEGSTFSFSLPLHLDPLN
jgi:PAS domain S-box-containing protein